MASTPTTGIYNPADFITQLNGTYKNDDGTTRSGSRGTIFEKNIRKLQPNTQAYFNELLYNEAMNAKAEGRAINRFDLKKIEHMLRAKYGNVDPKLKFFDISSWYSTNRRIAKELTNYINSVASQQPPTKEPEQEPDKKPEATQTETKQTETKENPNQKYIDAYHRLKQKKGTDEDLALFADWSEDKLKKFGFGPVTVKAIRDYANKPEETNTEPESQEQNTAKSAEQAATDYLGTSSLPGAEQKINEKYVDPKTGKKPVGGSSNFLNTGGFGARPEKEAAPAKPKYVPTAEEQALLDEAANLRKQVSSRNTAERTAAQKRLTEIQPQLNEIAKKKKAGGTVEENTQSKNEPAKKTNTQPGDKPVSELTRAYAEANGER